MAKPKYSAGSRHDEGGFSLLELVTIVSVLGILSAIAIPNFLCFVKESEVQAAVTTLIQMHRQCFYKKSLKAQSNPENVHASGYILDTDSQQPCRGVDGKINLTPLANNDYPALFIDTKSMKVGYSYNGYTGNDMGNCKNLVCGDLGKVVEDRLANSEYVIDNAYKRRGCSLYSIVKGASWEEAEAQAVSLGGNLVTINDKDEYKWIQKNIQITIKC